MRARGGVFTGRLSKSQQHERTRKAACMWNDEHLNAQYQRRPPLPCPLSRSRAARPDGPRRRQRSSLATRDFVVARVSVFTRPHHLCAWSSMRSARGDGEVRCTNHLFIGEKLWRRNALKKVKNQVGKMKRWFIDSKAAEEFNTRVAAVGDAVGVGGPSLAR